MTHVLCLSLILSQTYTDPRRACGATDNASDYGSEDSRFESWQARIFFFFLHFFCIFQSHFLKESFVYDNNKFSASCSFSLTVSVHHFSFRKLHDDERKVGQAAAENNRFYLFVGCLTSKQHASVFQGRIGSDNFTCCHTEIEAADPTFHLTQSQFTDTGPTSLSTDPITPGAWRGSHWSAIFCFKSLV